MPNDDKKKKVKESIPAQLDKRITALRRSHLGFIFQTFNLIPVLNVYENIEFPLILASKNLDSKSPVDDFTKAQKEEWISFLMEKVGLTDWKNHKANELSGGQRQRVAIARALVTKAPVILADEPTANLDSKNSEQILSLMKSLNKDPDLQTTFIFSTHDSRIVDMCDHVVHLLDGQITNDGVVGIGVIRQRKDHVQNDQHEWHGYHCRQYDQPPLERLLYSCFIVIGQIFHTKFSILSSKDAVNDSNLCNKIAQCSKSCIEPVLYSQLFIAILFVKFLSS